MNQEVKTINGYKIKDETARNQANENKSNIDDIKSVVKFHSVADSSATYIVEFPNGKNMIVDCGSANQWTSIKNAIDSLEINKFDYMILTHFHDDHIGNIQNLCDNYDLTECTCWVGMKPDYTNHADDLEESEEYYDGIITLLQSNGLTPVVPTNDSYVTIDENTKLHFLNTSPTVASDNNYYNQQAEWHNTGKVNLNMFSLITELIYGSKVITFTGDIETASEKGNYKKMRKCDILTAPHHGVNRSAYLPFYELVKPTYAILQYVTTSGGLSWIYPYFESFKYLQRVNAEIIAQAWAKPINGMYSFYINKNGIKHDIVNTGIPEEKIIKNVNMFPEVNYFIDYLQDNPTTINLVNLISQMPISGILNLYWYAQYNTTYPELYSDLVALYPNFTSDSLVKIEKIGVSTVAKIEILKNNIKVEAITNGTNTQTLKGDGILPNQSSTADLITLLKKLPIGRYQVNYFTDTSDTVLSSYSYVLDIVLSSNDGTAIQGSVIATQRETSNNRTNALCECYINSYNYVQYTWKNVSPQS